MKSFKEYLSESKKSYTFRVKVAGDVSSDQEKAMESLLAKYELSSFKKAGKTPIQELPLDFPKVKNKEVNIYEFTVSYPTTQFELTEYLSSEMAIAKECIVVRRPGEPYEIYQEKADAQESPLLLDSEYKEALDVKGEELYGDKYNSGFVKELNDLLRLQRKERGEVIPEASDKVIGTDSAAKFNTDAQGNTKSPIMQAPDPRKK